jgi:solute carrier family 25 protein 38
VPTALRVGLGGGIYFSLLEALAGDRPSQQRGSLRLMFAAAAARTAGFIATAPILVVKTRFEADRARGRSLLPTLLHLARSEGLRGLYAGFGATLLRDVPLAAIYVPLYTSARSVLAERFARGDRSHGGVVFVSGLAASAVASAVTQPADVVRTRLQLEPAAAARAASTLEAMRAVAREGGGVRGFFAGVVPRTLKRSLASGLTWLLYEKLLLLPRPRSFG